VLGRLGHSESSELSAANEPADGEANDLPHICRQCCPLIASHFGVKIEQDRNNYDLKVLFKSWNSIEVSLSHDAWYNTEGILGLNSLSITGPTRPDRIGSDRPPFPRTPESPVATTPNKERERARRISTPRPVSDS